MKKVTFLVLAFFLLLAPVLAGCGQQETEGQQDEASVLRVRSVEGNDIVGADPGLVSGENVNVGMAIYSRLMNFAPDSYELQLDAAKSVEVSEDGTEIYFELKEGIQFHQGYGEMTAEDVKFSFERIIDPELALPGSTDWEGLDYVEVTGKYTGIIHMKEPSAQLFTLSIPHGVGGIICKAAYEELGREMFNSAPVGSGPYEFKEWLPGDKIILERFDDYFGEKPYFDRVEIYVMEDVSVAELAFERGDLDVTTISLDSVPLYENNPDVNLTLTTALAFDWIGFNHSLPPFDDIRVREAVRYAVDIDQVIEGAYHGLANRANGMMTEGVIGYWADAPQYDRDLDKARALLAEAGYADGFETEMILRTAGYMAAAEIVQAQLKEVGIETTIRVAPDRYETLGPENHPGLHVAGFSCHVEPSFWITWFTTDQIGSWNFWKFSNEEFDRLNAEALVTLDEVERAQKYIRMQEIIDEEVACIYITNRAIAMVSDPEIKTGFFPSSYYAQYQYFKKVK